MGQDDSEDDDFQDAEVRLPLTKRRRAKDVSATDDGDDLADQPPVQSLIGEFLFFPAVWFCLSELGF